VIAWLTQPSGPAESEKEPPALLAQHLPLVVVRVTAGASGAVVDIAEAAQWVQWERLGQPGQDDQNPRDQAVMSVGGILEADDYILVGQSAPFWRPAVAPRDVDQKLLRSAEHVWVVATQR
jgi:hypothetical protein